MNNSSTMPRSASNVDLLLRLDDADAGRSGNHAGDDESDDRRHSDARQRQDEDQRDRVGRHQLGQQLKTMLGHCSVVYEG